MKNEIKRKNFNNQKYVQRVMPSGITKVIVTYIDGTHEEMLKSKADQIIREVK
ncbi:hypothetical protein PSYG_00028 [Psychrobacter phage pOW20-A]|uniref:hypothetical protein n=1 Tax=Psychrobacter phage pOW20-A TaxID=754048 RepID=UPI0002C18ABE|nr:hypothetical protein PSYG_00028 [Psychrobacter phage pOW20-A]AGH57489.1 hypothetical protein PSYG_00028 [Psychrobacter phage pOW20-A]